MSKQEVLQQVLERAHRKGYRLRGTALPTYDSISVARLEEATGQAELLLSAPKASETVPVNLLLLFYEVAFAQAVFGDFWEMHLNLLAAASNPIDYFQLVMA